MFTGIIEQTAPIESLSKGKDGYRLVICPGKNLDSVKIGDSISVNGTCLTIVEIKKNRLAFDIMAETFRNTSFPDLKKNDVVNVERSLALGSRIDGHFVLGHVDRVQRIKSIEKHPRPFIEVTLAPDDRIYLAKKGSIAIDGISLTIGEIHKESIRFYLIPHTLKNTNLKYKKKDDPVNVEFDVLGKYIQNGKLYKKNSASGITNELLKKSGFI